MNVCGEFSVIIDGMFEWQISCNQKPIKDIQVKAWMY
jgi:hypothetical protein